MNICKADIYFIIVMVFMMYLFYKIQNLTNVKENFAVQDDVKAAINEVYQADVDAIRNLSAVAKKLQEGGLTSAGNLTVAGELYVNNWLRVRGNHGIYFEDRGGGWCMTDNDWIRSYGGKNVYCDKQLVGSYVRSDSDLQVNGSSQVNGNSKVNGQSEIGGNLLLSGANTWMLHTPDDGRKTLYFGKGKDGAIDDWPITFDENGTINCKKIKVGKWFINGSDDNILEFTHDTNYTSRFNFRLISDVGHLYRWRANGANNGRIAG